MAWKIVMIGAAPMLVLAAMPAGAIAGPPKVQEASIPFVNMGSIRDWRADGDKALYVQDLHGKWYHATLLGSCSGLPYADAIGFETRGIDTLDKFAAVVVRGQRCQFARFTASGAPPVKKAHAHKG